MTSTAVATTTTRTVSTGEPVTLTGLVSGWLLAKRGSELTRNAYRCDFVQWAKFCDDLGVHPIDVDRRHIDAWAETLTTEGRAPSTVARKLAALSSFYTYCQSLDVVTRNPVDHVQRPKVAHDESTTLGLEQPEAAAVMAAAATNPTTLVLVGMLLVCGMRVSEALGVNVEHLDTRDGNRTVRVHGKGGKPRTVVIPAPLVGAVDALIAGRTEGPLLTKAGVRLNRNQATYLVAKTTAAAGVTKTITPHSLRHTCATTALNARVPLHHVQDQLGHADPRTTRRYDRGREQINRSRDLVNAITAALAV